MLEPLHSHAEPQSSWQQLIDILCQELRADAIERDHAAGIPRKARQWIRHHGFLGLNAPVHSGGQGWSWSQLSAMTRQIARVDSSVAHLLSYHYLGLTIPQIFGESTVADDYFRRTVEQQLFWCNALNPRDRRTRLRAEDGRYRLNGIKSFCSGSHDSDVIPTTAWVEDSEELVIVILATHTPGVELIDDWNNIGQRQTSSGTIRFQDVLIEPDQIFYPSRITSSARASIRTLLAQQNLANIYLGIAEGALGEALGYGRARQQASLQSKAKGLGDSSAGQILDRDRFAQLWVLLQAADAHYERSMQVLENVWRQGQELTTDQRGHAAITIATTKVLASNAALTISSAIFERLGARFTDASYGLDRFWRNIRTLSLHDSAEGKLQEIGEYLVDQRFPDPGFYSRDEQRMVSTRQRQSPVANPTAEWPQSQRQQTVGSRHRSSCQ